MESSVCFSSYSFLLLHTCANPRVWLLSSRNIFNIFVHTQLHRATDLSLTVLCVQLLKWKKLRKTKISRCRPGLYSQNKVVETFVQCFSDFFVRLMKLFCSCFCKFLFCFRYLTKMFKMETVDCWIAYEKNTFSPPASPQHSAPMEYTICTLRECIFMRMACATCIHAQNIIAPLSLRFCHNFFWCRRVRNHLSCFILDRQHEIHFVSCFRCQPRRHQKLFN